MTFAQQVQDALSEQAAIQIAGANILTKDLWDKPQTTNAAVHVSQCLTQAATCTERAAWLLAAVNNLAVPNATH